MAKQQPKQTQAAAQKAAPGQFNTANYLLRNLIVIAVIGFIFIAVYKSNEKQGQLPELYQEFSQLRQSGTNPERQQELYNQIMEIQNDTSSFKN